MSSGSFLSLKIIIINITDLDSEVSNFQLFFINREGSCIRDDMKLVPSYLTSSSWKMVSGDLINTLVFP